MQQISAKSFTYVRKPYPVKKYFYRFSRDTLNGNRGTPNGNHKGRVVEKRGKVADVEAWNDMTSSMVTN